LLFFFSCDSCGSNSSNPKPDMSTSLHCL
jgi:hypothetical protein